MTDRRDPPPDAPLLLSPFCRWLESKKHSFATAPARSEDDYLDASCHCWCRRTMQVLGPDKEPANPADCRSARACFQALA